MEPARPSIAFAYAYRTSWLTVYSAAAHVIGMD